MDRVTLALPQAIHALALGGLLSRVLRRDSHRRGNWTH